MTEKPDHLSRAAELAAPLPGLLLEAERVAQSFMRGVHGRRRVGTGETFWQFRPWTEGDSSRDIDWRQTAKRDHAFVRQTEWEAAQSIWLYRDASLSMTYHSKKDYADVLLLALSMIFLSGGEQVGLLGTDMAPQSGYASAQRLYETLPRQDQLSEGGRPIAANSFAILISDFFFPIEQLARFCDSLAARNIKGLLLQVYDEDEKALSYRGHVQFEDVENMSAPPLLIPDAGAIRDAYEKKFVAHQQELNALAVRLGWGFNAFTTDTKAETALIKIYEHLAPK